VKTLQDKDALPVEDLGDMAKGNFSVSDLAILLDNAGHVNNVKSGNVSESEVSEAKNAAKKAGADVPDFDAGQVATLLNRVLQ